MEAVSVVLDDLDFKRIYTAEPAAWARGPRVEERRREILESWAR